MMRKHDLLEKQKTKKEKNPEKKGCIFGRQ